MYFRGWWWCELFQLKPSYCMFCMCSRSSRQTDVRRNDRTPFFISSVSRYSIFPNALVNKTLKTHHSVEDNRNKETEHSTMNNVQFNAICQLVGPTIIRPVLGLLGCCWSYTEELYLSLVGPLWSHLYFPQYKHWIRLKAVYVQWTSSQYFNKNGHNCSKLKFTISTRNVMYSH